MLFRPPSTSKLEIWWVIYSDSSLSSPCSLLPLTSHLALPLSCLALFFLPPTLPLLLLFYVPLLPSICISSLPSSTSVSSSSSPLLLFTSTTCLLFLLSPHFHLLFPNVCVPLLHLLSASPYLFPSLPPLICLFITYTHALSSLHPQVQYSAYVGVGGLLSVVKLFCGGLFFWFLVKFSLGRKLLTTVATLFIKPTSYCNVCVGICSLEQIIWSPLEADFKGSRSFKMINPSIKVWMNATVRCGYLAERLTQSYSC